MIDYDKNKSFNKNCFEFKCDICISECNLNGVTDYDSYYRIAVKNNKIFCLRHENNHAMFNHDD